MLEGKFYITGDIHGSITSIIDFIENFNLNENDNIIVLGDMGIVWRTDQKDYEYAIKFYEKWCHGVNLYWLDGNHENFDIIKTWKCNENGIYNNSEHIHYCSRGTVLNINNKKVLFIGGADSVDRYRRVEHDTWWKEETITEENIKNITGHFDYVFSHCCPRSVFNNNKVYLCTLTNINEKNAIHNSEDMLEKLKNNISYDNWWFAHYHIDRKLDDKHRCLFEDFIELI